MYDISTGRETQITNDNSKQQINPDVFGETIIWQDSSYDIFMWSPLTGEQLITTNPSVQINPSISGNNIAWFDDRNEKLDIYMKKIVEQ